MADNSFGIKELNLVGSGTPKIESPNNLNLNAVTVAISTNASVGGTLIIQGQSTFDNAQFTGVSTFGEGISLPDNKKAEFGNTAGSADLEIFHTGASSVIRTTSTATGGLNIRSEGDIVFGTTITPTDDYIKAFRDGAIELYYDGSKKFETSETGAVVTGILTATSDVKVGSGVTISSSGDIFNTGITTNAKQIVGLSTNNVIPFYYNEVSEFPSASTYHGAVAHAHNTGRLYFAHAGWKELVNKESNGVVGTGTESYNVGVVTATSFSGDGSNLTNVVASNITLTANNDSLTYRVPFASANTGSPALYSDGDLTFNPNTGNLSATKFVGDLSDSVTSRWSVGNNGFSHYTFTGPGGLNSADDPTIYLARGQTYEFNLNASGHPFQIQTSSGGYNSGNVYTTGITNAGAAVGVIKFEVPFSAPNTLYYVCQNHSNMAGTIIIYPSI